MNKITILFLRSYIFDIKEDKQSGAKGKEGVARERVKDALLIDPALLGKFFFFLRTLYLRITIRTIKLNVS